MTIYRSLQSLDVDLSCPFRMDFKTAQTDSDYSSNLACASLLVISLRSHWIRRERVVNGKSWRVHMNRVSSLDMYTDHLSSHPSALAMVDPNQQEPTPHHTIPPHFPLAHVHM